MLMDQIAVEALKKLTADLMSLSNFDEIVHILIESATEVVEDEIDRTQFKSYISAFLEPFVLIRKSFSPVAPLEMENAVDDLLKTHDVGSIDEGDLLKTCFHELAQYDKLVKIDGKIAPVLLSQLFDLMTVYKELLAVHKKYGKEADSLDRTIALSTSHTPEKMLVPLNPYLKKNLHNGEIKPEVYENIINAYKDDPYATDFALSAMRSLGADSLLDIDPERILAFDFASQFANSSLQVHTKDIIKSLKIAISLLYLKDHMYQKLLGLEHHIPHEKLAAHIDLILGYVFDIDTQKKKTDPRKFKSKIQIRTHFDTVPLYEYARKGKEKAYPVIENTEFVYELQEKIKGKISKFSPVLKPSE